MSDADLINTVLVVNPAWGGVLLRDKGESEAPTIRTVPVDPITDRTPIPYHPYLHKESSQ